MENFATYSGQNNSTLYRFLSCTFQENIRYNTFIKVMPCMVSCRFVFFTKVIALLNTLLYFINVAHKIYLVRIYLFYSNIFLHMLYYYFKSSA